MRLKIIVSDFLESLYALSLALICYVHSLAVNCAGQRMYFAVFIWRVSH